MIGPPRRAIGPIAIGAVALAASYPPFSLPFMSFVAVTPAVLLIRQSVREEDAAGAFRVGFWYGFAAQAAVLYWLIVALWHFTPLAALGYLATITLEALWSGVLFWFVVRMRLRVSAVPLAIVLPVAWTAMEWALGHQGDIRFPWLGLGTSLADARLLVQWADIAGARGVTFWLAWCNVMVVEGLLPVVGARRAVARRLVPMAVTIVAAAGYGAWRERTLPVLELGTIGLVQPNEGFWEKWNPAHEDSVVTKLIRMSRQLNQGGRLGLLIWPEAAIPGYFTDHPKWDEAIAQLARGSRVPILTGGLNVEFHGPRSYDYFNAAFFYDSAGSHLFDVVDHFFILAALRGEEHHGHALVDQRDRSMLHLGGGHAFGVDVADFLELQRAFERHRIVISPAKEQPVLALAESVGNRADRVALPQHFGHLIGDRAQAVDHLVALLLAHELPPAEEQRQHREHDTLAGEGFC